MQTKKAMTALHEALELIDVLICTLDDNDIESDWAAECYASIEFDYMTLVNPSENQTRPDWLKPENLV